MAEPQDLRDKAQRYHRLADVLAIPADARALHELAQLCEQRAEEGESDGTPSPSPHARGRA